MDEHFVQGVVGGVLNRHKDRPLDEKRIQTLMVEISAVLDRAIECKSIKKQNEENLRNYEFIMNEMSEGEKEHLRNWTRGKAEEEQLEIMKEERRERRAAQAAAEVESMRVITGFVRSRMSLNPSETSERYLELLLKSQMRMERKMEDSKTSVTR